MGNPQVSVPTKRGKAWRTEQRIRNAAYNLFERQGYTTTTIEQIAREAGIGRRTFFRHFSQKESLLFERETFESFVDEFRQQLTITNDPLSALLECYQNPVHFPPDPDDEMSRRRRRLRAQLRGDAGLEAYYSTFIDRTERALLSAVHQWQQEVGEVGNVARRYSAYLIPGLWRTLSIYHVDSGEDHHYDPDLPSLLSELAVVAANAVAWRDRQQPGTRVRPH